MNDQMGYSKLFDWLKEPSAMVLSSNADWQINR